MKNSLLLKSIFLVLAYAVLNGALIFYFNKDRQNRQKIYFEQKVDKLLSEYRATKHGFKMLSDFVHDEIGSEKEILSLIDSLKSSKNDKTAQKIRKTLYSKLKKLYTLLTKYKIYYMTLYFPDGKVFLRMHQPYKHGDYIYKKDSDKKRFDFVSSQLTPNEIETGIIQNYPLFFGGRLLAHMKTSISYDVLKQELTKLFNSDYEYIIKKEFISNSALRVGQKLFIQSDISEEYFYEENSIKRDRSRVNNETIHKINSILKSKISKRLDLKNNLSVAVKVDGKYYVVTFLTISPAKNAANIGYLISYEEDDTYALFETNFWNNVILGNIITFLILGFLFYVMRMNEKLKLIAATDKLTGLFNRNKFYELAELEIERSKRYDRPLSLLIFDIDHFKTINDRYGHNVGDYVLKTMADIIRKNIRKHDFIFRWGGEEFIILAPETNLEGAVNFAEKLRERVEEFQFKDVEKVTISIGVATYDQERDKDIDSLINRADEALYRSKSRGRNMVTAAD